MQKKVKETSRHLKKMRVYNGNKAFSVWKKCLGNNYHTLQAKYEPRIPTAGIPIP